MVPRPGLSSIEAARRIGEHGPNRLRQAPPVPVWRLFAAQLASPLVALLGGACVLSAAVGDGIDAAAIGVILLLNATIGTWQEHQAQGAIHALRKLTAPRARVVRDGLLTPIPAEDVVPGDLLALEAGDRIAADGVVVECASLAVDEAPLTGESLPVDKDMAPSAPDAPLAERHDRVFLGTTVTRGTGRVEVVATGMSTEMGRIAALLAAAEDPPTPLQVELARVGRTLLWVCLSVVVAVVIVGRTEGQGLLSLALDAIPLAVAAVPEGLPAVVTVALAVGVQRMAARNVLVRRLPAVETLGATSVICTDKTGTLTTGAMAVRELWGDADRVLDAAAACCDAELHGGDDAVGDPTEIALLRAARERGIHREDIERERPRVGGVPFDSDRKRMSVLRADGVLYVKGALDGLVAHSARLPAGVEAAAAELSARGLRVLGVATGPGPDERDLDVLGLVGMADPPRPEAFAAVADARRAGIHVVMITGDHALTAAAIARELGIVGADESPEGRVHARVTPEDKVQIVRRWRARGAVVAMTGDGVNDTPAIQEAHVGVAMGLGGTEVAREAADLVLADDNFASIVAGVREGRGIYENIRKTVLYLLGGNTGELMIIGAATVAGLPLPLLPLQLLWINLVTDGLPALALVMDPAHDELLERPPRDVSRPMLGRGEWLRILGIGALDATAVLAVYTWALSRGDVDVARSLAFSTLVCAEVLRALAARSAQRTLWELGWRTNPRLLAVVAASLALQIALHHIPVLNGILGLQPVHASQAVVVFAAGALPFVVLEALKVALRFTQRA